MAHIGNQFSASDSFTGKILWRFAAGGSVVAGAGVVDVRAFSLPGSPQ